MMDDSKAPLLDVKDLEKGREPNHTKSLSWENLSVSVKRAAGGTDTGKDLPEYKVLLNGVSGHAETGSILAIMGPSGSGKTTLLNALAGRLAISGGRMLLNGHGFTTDQLNRMAGYVVQDDMLFAFLTVRETIMYSAELRLGSRVSKEERAWKVDQVISQLGLDKVKDSFVGSAEQRGISGGERKRVSIGVEMVTDPQVMFLDEPTSGLDSAAALAVMQSLKDMAKQGKIVITTIHQPRSNIVQLFDQVLLLAGGSDVFLGDGHQMVPHFKSNGFECPTYVNPADFVLDVVSEDAKAQQLTSAWRNKSFKPIAPADSRPNLQETEEPGYPSSFFRQVSILTVRALKRDIRNPVTFRVQLSQSIFMAVLVGLIYWRLGDNEADVQSRAGALYFILSNQVFSAVSSLPLFLEEREIFKREQGAGSYRVSSYFLSKLASDLPFRVIIPAVFCFGSYWIVNLNPKFSRFAVFLCLTIVLNNVGSAYVTAIGSMVPNFQIGSAISAVFIVLMMLFGGFFTNLNSIGVGISWLQYISIFKYGYEALMINEFKGETFDGGVTGEAILEKYAMDEDRLLWDSMALLLLFIFYRLVTYIVLLRLARSTKRQN